VARWDYLRWHFILNCQICGPLEEVTTLWEMPDGEIAAVLHPLEPIEAFLEVHPAFRTPQLEDEMLAQAETTFPTIGENGEHRLYVPVDFDDTLRKDVLRRRGYVAIDNPGYEFHRDLDGPLPPAPLPEGYSVRSMGGPDEHPARSWASWTAFHPDEPDENYEGWDWFQNLQSAPLYRRDLDLVAVTEGGEVASFCTIFFDDVTRSAVCVLVGTAAAHQRRGLGKAVLTEGLRRLQWMGCKRAFAKAFDPPARAFYGSVMDHMLLSETWQKEWKG
jgi:mycothiol synthase